MTPFTRYLSCLLLILPLGALPLTAQTDDDDDVIVLSPFEVQTTALTGYAARDLVSVGRLSATQLETSRAVSIVTSELLQDLKADDLASALEYAAAVDQNSGGWVNTLGDNVSIRGIDGGFTFRNFYRSNTTPWSVTVDRIEIVKGPSALMYGVTSPGGQINYLTKRPQFIEAAEIDLRIGRWNLFQAVLDYQNTAFTDTWAGDLAYRAVAAYRQDGWFENDTYQDRYVGLFSLAWRPTSKDKLTLEIEGQDHEYIPSLWTPLIDPTLDMTGSLTERFTGQASVSTPLAFFRERDGPEDMPYMPGRYYNPLGPGLVTTREYILYSADYEHAFNETWSFKATWLYEDGDTYELNADHTLFDKDLTHYRRAFFRDGTQLLRSATALLTGELEVHEDLWTNQFLLGGSWYKDIYTFFRKDTSDVPGKGLVSFGEPLDFLALASVDENELGRDINGDGEIGLIPIPEFLGQPYDEELFPFWYTIDDAKTSFENTAYWITNDFRFFNSKLIVRGGYRWDEFEQRRFGNARANPRLDSEGIQEAESLQYSVLYRPTDSISIYYAYSESIRDQFVFAAGEVAPPVRGEGGEVGIKFSLFNNRITGAMAYYDLTVTDQVERNPEAPGFINQPDEEFSGFEIEIGAQPIDGLSIIASYAYIEAVQLIPPDQSRTRDWAEERSENIPDHRAALWARYDFAEGSLDGWYVGAGVKYVGDRTYEGLQGPPFGASGPGNTQWNATFWQAEFAPRPQYTLVDALVGYSWQGRWFEHDVSLKIDNVFDEHYIVSFLKWGEPRNWKFSWNMKF